MASEPGAAAGGGVRSGGRFGAFVPYGAMLGVVTAIPLGASFATRLFPVMGAQGATFLRVGFSALILLVVWRPWRQAWRGRDLLGVARYGVVLGLMNLSFYMALRTLPMGVVIATEFLGPLGLSLFHTRRLSDLLWPGLAAAGLLLLLPVGSGVPSGDVTGFMWALAAGLCWALYILAGQRLSHIHPGRAVALGMVVATLVTAPAGLIAAGAAVSSDPSLLGLGLVVAVLSGAVPYTLEMIALGGIPKRIFGVLATAEPVMGALVGMVCLHEMLTARQWVAIGCVMAAGAGAVLTKAPSESGEAGALPVEGME